MQDLSEELSALYSRVSLQCKAYLQSDPRVEREDTCRGLLSLLQQLKSILSSVNSMGVEDRAKNYHVAYNAINYILDISDHLRRTSFAFEASLVLVEAIKAMEGNLVLQDVKYLDKRTEIYLQVSRIYENEQYYQQAVSLLDVAIKNYKELKAIHDLDSPVPHYIQAILTNNLKIIKIFHLKYSMQAGVLSPAQWKKKADEEFQDDAQAKLMCLVECLRTQTKKHSNIFTKNLKPFKDSLLINGFDIVKPHLQNLVKGLAQKKEKIEREVNFKNTLNATQQQINEEIKKKREIQDKYLKESQVAKASQAFPLQYHAQLIHYALQTKNTKILSELIEGALLRIQCRRIEVPYVNDVTIIVSSSPYPNVPNGYTKIPVDLNEANLRKELTKLRKSGKKAPDDESLKVAVGTTAPGKQEKKDSKKGGKQPVPPPVQNKEKEATLEPSEWQLNEIKHKYVFMMVKKSMNPEGALYDIGVVLGNEQKGPVGFADNRRIIVPYVQENMNILESSVNQHTGVRETTGLVPFIILHHSRNGLESEQQQKTIITDIAPLVGKNPMVPPKWGYRKIEVDLRQVPVEFIKAPNHDYIYLTFKTDELFHISERHIRIIKAFVELEATYGQKKGTSNEEEKELELQMNYDLQKLGAFFQSLQQALLGELGQEYYLQRTDFLTHLTFEIWSKYLKNPLLQFDYMKEQRLNGEIIDEDYQAYRKIIQNCNSTYLRGLKVLNLIMVNNSKTDILLQCKITLELCKMLEDSKMYKMAADNLKLCLDRLRLFRDEYLSKGVEGIHDKILPFSVTCSSSQIKRTVEAMKKKFYEQRRHLEKANRIKDRQKKGLKQLTPEQLQQQEKQFIRLRKLDNFDQIVDKVNTRHSQLYSIAYALELDLMNLYFRVSLKRSEEIIKLEASKNDMTNGIRNSELEGLATTLKQKLGLNQGPTQTKNIQVVGELQNTLVKANKLPPPKPKLDRTQLRLIIQNQKNPYALALLMINLAALNSDNKDKRYYLQQSLNYIQKCAEVEKALLSSAVEHAIFIFSGLWDSKIQEDENSERIYPFKDLYNSLWQTETDVPPPPILISKNSTSIHLKLPPFIPTRKDKKVVKFMSVFGKPSANGVDVSLNCTELEGTGIRKQIGKTVKVSSLECNNLYCFAAAGVDKNQEVMAIGKTGEDIGTFNPLSICMLAGYLAKVSYQINQYEIAEKAAKIILNEYCTESKYMTADERTNNLYYYCLNEATISTISLFEMKPTTEAFYIMALCERRNLNQLKENNPQKPPKIYQEKEKVIANLLMISAALTPAMSSPNMSIPFLIPESETLLRAIVINMIPQKWMNPKIRKIGAGVMQRLLKWGIENNEVNLSRRLAYKWNERKYLLMGKMIQVQQKKQVKKGGKDSKEQEVKLIDKYCRFMIQKSPQLMDAFQDSIIMISDDYYDYVALFIERAKEQISTMTQFVDNPAEQMDSLSAHLTLKLELVEYLKEPLLSIKKIANTSPYYLQYNSKILKKALEMASQSQYKQLLAKAEELDIPDITEEIKWSKEICELMFSAIKEDIAWNPSSKKELILFQQKTGKDLSKAISIFDSWQQKKVSLTNKIRNSLTFYNKHKDFDYLNMWISELYHLKAQCYVVANCNDFTVKRRIKVRYDKINSLSLDDLFKKQTEVAVLQDKPYAYSEEQLKKLTQILNCLSQAAYTALLVQNWLKFQSILKFLCNFLCYVEITPFYHRGSSIWSYFAFISLCSIEMLNRIKTHGFWQFKQRYYSKLMNTERFNITNKLQSGDFSAEKLIEEFVPEYYMPDLDSSTTKSFWFFREKNVDIEAVGSIIAYTVNTLRLENKHNLVINIVRDFCNATQHYFSLALLPFMTNSQSKLLQEVQKSIQLEHSEMFQLQKAYQIQIEKKGKKRAAMMSGEKMEFQIVYEAKNKKLKESLTLLNEQKAFIESQTQKSNKIKDQISRDTSKQVLTQKEQRKYTHQFGEHYEQMLREFGEQAKQVKKSKNFIKDIINKYMAIYDQLKNNKTSKNTLAEIQNRNDVGNLCYASGMIQQATEFWKDSLATIFRTVDPIENYHTILQEKQPYLVKNVGDKEVIIAICLLYKISNFGCGHKLNIQRLSSHFACNLAYSLFQISLDYPQTYEMFKDFRIKKFPSRLIFSDEDSINLIELLAALEYFVFRNIYDENYIPCLPLVTFYDYIATDVVKNAELSLKAKMLKSIVLSEAGLISQSINYLAKVANEKDLPILWLQSSDYLKKQKGMNWRQQGLVFKNSQFWTSPDNKIVIDDFKKIVLRPESISLYGILCTVLFNYAKSLVLFKIYQTQICRDEALNDQRLQVLSEAEIMMRECIKKTAVIQEFYSLLEQYQNTQLTYKRNEVSDDFKKQMQSSRAKMIDFLKKNGIDDNLVKVYERQQSTPLKRAFRLQLMCRIRFSLHKISESKNLYSNSFHILKNGMNNMHRYSIGSRLCESGYDPQIKSIAIAAPVIGKKDDKKGGKKQEEVISQGLIIPPIDTKKQSQNRTKNESKSTRCSSNSYWHLKMLFQIAKVLFKQNNFSEAIKIFQKVLQYSKKYEEQYFRLLSMGFISRAKLRLGHFFPQQFKQTINQLEKRHILDFNYVNLVMDFGEVTAQPENLLFLTKGKNAAAQIWKSYGMHQTLDNIGLASPTKKYYLKDQATAEQDQIVKRKKKGQKKAGKEDKKAAPKKQDPKKKIIQSKSEYKVVPLSKVVETNLLEQEKNIMGEYNLSPHPNFNKNNIYQMVGLVYIKAYLMHLQEQMRQQQQKNFISVIPQIIRLLNILETFAHSTDHLKIILYYSLGRINKFNFVEGLKQLLQSTPNPYIHFIQTPFQDLPLNNTLIRIPAYSEFISKNRKLLLEAKGWLKRCLSLVQNWSLFYQRTYNLEDIAWHYADNQCLLTEYVGREKPKYFPEDQVIINQEERRLEVLNNMLEGGGFLQLAIKIRSIKSQLSRCYLEIGSKGLDQNVKIDEDISAEIMEMDRQSKRNYPQYMLDIYKGKIIINGTDLITYMLKIHHEADVMTFTHSNYQNLLYKCNRILTKYLSGYKEKCTLKSIQVPLKKSIKDKFIEYEAIMIKSIRRDRGQVFLYLLGPANQGDQSYYGRITIQFSILSRITQDLLSLTTKSSISDKKSESVRNRDYILHKKEFQRILNQFSLRFGQNIDVNSLLSADEKLVELTTDNLKIMKKILDSEGLSTKNKEINKYLRHLHKIKYLLT